MKNSLILLALISSFVLAGCPKEDKAAPVPQMSDAEAQTTDHPEAIELK